MLGIRTAVAVPEPRGQTLETCQRLACRYSYGETSLDLRFSTTIKYLGVGERLKMELTWKISGSPSRSRAHLRVEPRTLLRWAREGKIRGSLSPGPFVMCGAFAVKTWMLHSPGQPCPKPKGWFNEKAARHKQERSYSTTAGTWNFLQWVDGKRKSKVIGTRRSSHKGGSMAQGPSAAYTDKRATRHGHPRLPRW